MLDSRAMAALLSSLVSELILLLPLLPPSFAGPLPLDSDVDPFDPRARLLHLIHYFLSSTDLAASFSLVSLSSKRKRIRSPESDSRSDAGDEDRRGRPAAGPAPADSDVARSPDSFKLCFRMSSSTFEWLSGLLEPLLDCRDPPGSPLDLPAGTRLGIGLFRLATGSDYSDLAWRFGVSESASRFCAKQLCRVLCTNFRFWVAFPSSADLKSVSAELESLAGLPNCCGVIDCARFQISKMAGRESSAEDKPSIAAQIVVDSSSRILNIVAGYRGDRSNFQVLKSCTLFKDVQEGSSLSGSSIELDGAAINQYLIGNGGYPLLPWLMPPFVDPLHGSCEDRFNGAHKLMRLSASRTVASLKHWGVLGRPMEEEFKTAVAYIGACSILHNVLLAREDYSALSDAGVEQVDDENSQHFSSSSSEESSIEGEASFIRSALARRAMEFWNSKHLRAP